MGRNGMHIKFWWKSQERDLDVGGRIILKWTLDWMGWWGGFIWLRVETSGRLL
jgi:hypothetical protein